MEIDQSNSAPKSSELQHDVNQSEINTSGMQNDGSKVVESDIGSSGLEDNDVDTIDEIEVNLSDFIPKSSELQRDVVELEPDSSGNQNNRNDSAPKLSGVQREVVESDQGSSDLEDNDVDTIDAIENNQSDLATKSSELQHDAIEMEHRSSGMQYNGNDRIEAIEIGHNDLVPKSSDVERDVNQLKASTSGMQNNGSNSVPKSSEVQQIADSSDDDDASIALTDTTINAESDESKENIAPLNISSVSSEVLLLPFLPPVEMQNHVGAQHALAILDCNVPNTSNLSTPMIPTAPALPPADFEGDLICMDDPSSLSI
ncbi:dentin sialophosphoprotein-like [Sitodiplosis mosellana]|uniref:dentin sialophosphoprotein-like n=1 Tax=Sitodiplosis mosellana TaxID=263140 RepID=UPI002443B238|nr:dentin sialophosphoprotein-like [Sitodiplosis mosellana]